MATASNTGTAWHYWVSVDCGTAATTSNAVWSTWTCDSTSAVSSNVWTAWVTVKSDGVIVQYHDSRRPSVSAEEAERRRIEAERQRGEWEAAEEKRKAEEAKAEATAKELLGAFLTPKQR